MTVVYATGQPRFFEFATASGRDSLPAGAFVVAVCDGERTTEFIDEATFERMSDEEYYELQGIIAEVKSRESARAEVARKVAPLGGVWDSLPRCRACEWMHA